MPFVKGQVGNPKGRPKAKPLTPYDLRQHRREFTAMSLSRIQSVGEALVSKAIELALNGNEKMIALLWDRFYDKNFLNKLETPLKTSTASEIDHSQEVIIEKMGLGEIDPEHGIVLSKALTMKRDSSLIKDLETQVNQIVGEQLPINLRGKRD